MFSLVEDSRRILTLAEAIDGDKGGFTALLRLAGGSIDALFDLLESVFCFNIVSDTTTLL